TLSGPSATTPFGLSCRTWRPATRTSLCGIRQRSRSGGCSAGYDGVMRVASFGGIVTAVTVALAGALFAFAGACTTKEPESVTFFDQTIDPVLQASCVRTNTGVGCHVSDTRGNAFGNLDLSNY